jgi:DNA-directed RNA polymerase specialized sigma24 family protein
LGAPGRLELLPVLLATLGEPLVGRPARPDPGDPRTLGGWLFQIARHDLYDHRRRQSRSRVDPVDPEPGTETAVWKDQLTHAALSRLSPREREVLALLGGGWSNAEIGRELYISLHTVRPHVENILQKLDMHSMLEAASFAMQHGWTADPEGLDTPVMGHLEDAQVMAALQRLSAEQREVVLLRMVAGLTVPEVATALGKSVGAVKALQHRGLNSLARVLGLRSLRETHEGGRDGR